MGSLVRLTGALRGRTAAVTIAGVATALLTGGTASAATIASSAHAHPAARAHHAVPVKHLGSEPARRAGGPAAQAAVAQPAVKTTPAAAPAAPQAPPSWDQIQHMVASQTSPSEPQAASVLQPVPTSGPQNSMPISASQQTNATTIVQQALAKKMGIRSAVIAVATSMQESQLQNINYGTSDSLGLFQQRPSMGWGTAAQITDPSFAANAFLGALQQYQAGDPAWASQPLWASAQAVQKSGFPFAYAKWESQAAGLVKQIAMQVK
jgi:hypothetical protein